MSKDHVESVLERLLARLEVAEESIGKRYDPNGPFASFDSGTLFGLVVALDLVREELTRLRGV